MKVINHIKAKISLNNKWIFNKKSRDRLRKSWVLNKNRVKIISLIKSNNLRRKKVNK